MARIFPSGRAAPTRTRTAYRTRTAITLRNGTRSPPSSLARQARLGIGRRLVRLVAAPLAAEVDRRIARIVGRKPALQMFDEHLAGAQPITLGGDRGYHTADFIEACRSRNVTPHVAMVYRRRPGIDGRTTRHQGVTHQSADPETYCGDLRLDQDGVPLPQDALQRGRAYGL